MANAKIGALRVDLGMNTAAFEKGLTGAERRLNKFSGSMKKLGSRLKGVGQSLTLGITAPIMGAAAAFSATAHKMAADSRQIANSAQVAGESFEEFQRQAFAAKSVGIEFEKLGDIFKDVRDRVGDFAATGGGPMADFFEKIAPKVGVTAEAFKGLSGKDSLQLYFNSLKKANVSQEEMVFYLEAMASDATNLIPLLEKNGKAMADLGKNANVITDKDRENFEKYTQAQEKLAEAGKKLTIALVDSGLLESVTSLVEKFAKFTSELAETNPGLLKTGVFVAGLAAAIGPLLVAVGSVISIFAGLGVAMGPVALVAAAIAAAGLLIYKNWDTIGPVLKELWTTLNETLGPPLMELVSSVKEGLSDLWNGPLGAMVKAVIPVLMKFQAAYLTVLGKGLALVISTAAKVLKGLFDQIRDGINFVSALFNGEWSRAFDLALAIVNRAFGGLPSKVAEWMRQLVVGVKRWVVDKLGAVWNQVTKGIETVKGSFFDLYDAVVGNSYVPDMVDGIADHMGRLDKVMVQKAKTTTEATKAAFRELASDVRGILDQAFPDAAALRGIQDQRATLKQGVEKGLISQDLADDAAGRLSRDLYGGRGPIEVKTTTLPSVDELLKNMPKVGDTVKSMSDKIEIQTVRIAKSFGDMVKDSTNALKNFADAIKNGGFFDILDAAIGLFTNLAGTGLFGGSLQSTFGGARAAGGPVSFGKSYLVGEEGPELFTPGAAGHITPNGAGGGGIAQIVPSPYFDVVVDGRVMRAAPAIAAGGASSAMAQMGKMRDRSLR